MTPAERRLAGRQGAFTMLSRNDPRLTSKAGRDAAEARYLLQVDPEGTLPIAERERRAAAARRAHMAEIALASVRARAARRRGGPQT